MPPAPRGHPYIGTAIECLFFLISGLQFGLGLHLISVFPERRAWLIKHPELIPGYYFVGIGFGAVVAATAVTEAIESQLFPWSFDSIDNMFSDFFLPAWACATVALLISTARRYPHLDGRRDAALLLVGILPWAVLVVVFAVRDSAFHVQPPCGLNSCAARLSCNYCCGTMERIHARRAIILRSWPRSTGRRIC